MQRKILTTAAEKVMSYTSLLVIQEFYICLAVIFLKSDRLSTKIVYA